MLGLKLPTDPNWVNIAENDISEVLTDHAWCEQKAASNAISLIINFPEHTEMVDALLAIAKEELTHFEMVHQKIKERGLVLGKERKDNYVNELYKFMKTGFRREMVLIDRLLFAAMIEARSCERFKVLSKNIKDEELSKFYHELMVSEANHYTTFVGFAKKYANGYDVDKRWKEWLDYEAEVILSYGKQQTIHG
jgi:tRNA 2-(methylsulfanyl)-N6-isopentenyladenosine37 hydroxylase